MHNQEDKTLDFGAATNKYPDLRSSVINKENKTVYLHGVWLLGFLTALSLISIVFLAYNKLDVPQALIAIGSVAVGALGSLFTNGR